VGQQQLLFLVLGVCIIGIGVSVGLINLQGLAVEDQRTAIMDELHQLGVKAQTYYRKPFDFGGGGGSFLRINMLPNGIEALGGLPSSPHAEFLIRRSGNSSRTQILAVGTAGGIDPALPIRMVMTVWPDSTHTDVLN
jgi:hypothetical protein